MYDVHPTCKIEPKIEPRFRVGDRVKAIAFTNIGGKPVAETRGLIVRSVTLHGWPAKGENKEVQYFRVDASEDDGFARVEGAERYFDSETA